MASESTELNTSAPVPAVPTASRWWRWTIGADVTIIYKRRVINAVVMISQLIEHILDRARITRQARVNQPVKIWQLFTHHFD
jgi:hypothetical protein